MLVAVDTNVLVYATGADNASKRSLALTIVQRIAPSDVVIPAQVLGELFNVLVRKARWRAHDARAAILHWREFHSVPATSAETIAVATELAAEHRLQIWDSIVLAVASASRCRLLLSEDMQEGFAWGGVTVVNPFAAARHPLLQDLLARPLS